MFAYFLRKKKSGYFLQCFVITVNHNDRIIAVKKFGKARSAHSSKSEEKDGREICPIDTSRKIKN